jgi:hypothetical protein
MKKKTCYIINFYFGERRCDVERVKIDRLCYLKSQIETLEKYKHSLSKIVFTFNIEPEHQEYFTEAMKIIPEKVQNTNIEINVRENIGMSYGAFSDVFKKYQGEYDYYIFNEDDYVIVDDNFDDYLVNKYESLPNCGYLCGLVREKCHGEVNRHAGLPSGISSYECLSKIFNKYNELPHSKDKDYYSNEEGQAKFTGASKEFGYEIYDIREEYKLDFWGTDTGAPPVINTHFMWNTKSLFLPVKIYLFELYRWIDKIDNEFLRMECDYKSIKYYPYKIDCRSYCPYYRMKNPT